jgi:transposase
VPADLACRAMKAKHYALAEALDDIFDDHHGEPARLLLDQIAALDGRTEQLGIRAGELAAAMPPTWGIDADGAPPGSAPTPGRAPRC